MTMKDIGKWLFSLLLDKIQLPKLAFWIIASILGGILWAIGNYNELCGGCLKWAATVTPIVAYIMGLLLQAKPSDQTTPAK